MRIQLITGNTITVSVYEYLFVLKEEDVDAFFQSCVADDLGVYIDNPFSSKHTGSCDIEEEIDDLPDL